MPLMHDRSSVGWVCLSLLARACVRTSPLLLTHPPVPLQIVTLILENQSVLHGRELHLSVADIAHLSLLRVPKGRIVD